ncbi:flagellar protein FlaG [Burkholderiaceae bacterium DAT-1]|nr:flagellar protein FlaG [Burkholderiaceae bacterium DAT-1]
MQLNVNGVAAVAATQDLASKSGTATAQTGANIANQLQEASASAHAEASHRTGSAGATESATSGAVNEAVSKLNSMTSALNVSLKFSVDPESKKNIVRVVDSENQQVIRQIPSEEAVSIAKAIDRFQGLLIRSQA